ncbi:hypothetical protein [Salinibacterium sp. PAMC 21357]|uniref:hypothetical protein n=1 Tax=Salinibacterium sp. PAMC 21357 TaxID=1112215 RepID=UPI000289F493|nr:hypothetical protein [Salinibacterium sp. PAMC 21357]
MPEQDELKLPGFIAESEVLPAAKNLGLRLLALLIGLGLLLGLAVAGGTAMLTTIWPTGDGLCDATAAPCSDVTIEQIAAFSAIDLPSTAEVEDAQYARVENTGLLYATVIVAAGDPDPLRSGGSYRVSPSLSWASEVDVLMLDNLVLYEGVESVTGPGFEAASGQRADGRTVIFIRVTRAI